MRLLLSLCLAFGLTTACAESDFAGDAKSAAKKTDDKKKGKDGDDAPGGEDAPGDEGKDEGGDEGGGIVEDDGEKTLGTKEEEPIEETNEICAASNPEKPADQAGTFVFANEGEVRTFLNALGKYTHVNANFFDAGGVQADQVSADAVCNIKGYKKAASFSTQRYHSCGDNFVYPWDPAVKNFKQLGACTNNNRVGQITCQGKLKDICGKDPGWVFGQPPSKEAGTTTP